MEEKKSVPKGLKRAIFCLIVLALVHTTLHLLIYGTSIPNFYEQGTYDLDLQFIVIDQSFDQQYPLASNISKTSVIVEWLLLVFLIKLAKKRKNSKKEIEQEQENPLIEHIKNKERKTKTDLDVLYELLKEKKKLKLSIIARTFRINQAIVKEWCDILENGNLATMIYPKIGEPQIAIIENKEDEK